MIRFDHVSKVFPGKPEPALDDITFEILRGEFVFLVGPSGSGKSSVLRLILREDAPTAGQVHVLGQDLSAISNRKVPYYRRNVGMVFQDFRLLPNKTVYENVAYALQVIGKSRGFIAEAVPDVLSTVGLDDFERRFPHELSGGEQQRVAIARAVVNKPPILLADEPTGNLDPATSADIMRLLSRISANGTTVVMATHDVTIVNDAKLRVIALQDGEIMRDEAGGVYEPEVIGLGDEQADGAQRAQPVEEVVDERTRKTIAESMAERVAADDVFADDAYLDASVLDVDAPFDEAGFDDDRTTAEGSSRA